MTRASRRKHHIVYKTTCMITGKFYIGLHSTDNLQDGYQGSGVHLWRSIKKHGKDQHTSEILECLPSRIEAAERKKVLIAEHLGTACCMNLIPGGTGYFDRPATKEETRAKMSTTHKRNNSDPEWKAARWATHKALMNRPETIAKNSEVQLKVQNKPEVKALRSRPCTIDGTTIYPSKRALEQALGTGNTGSRSPNLRFIEPAGPTQNVVGAFNAWADPIKRAARLEKRHATLQLKRVHAFQGTI